MTVHQRVPEDRQVDVEDLVQGVVQAERVRPFAPVLIDLCDRISAGLMRHPVSRRFPELVALAFWLRRAEITRLAREFASLENESTLLAPRGVVFHVPPGNVDTISVYSWALSLLVGNANIVRLSTRPSPVTDAIVDVLQAALSQAPKAVQDANCMVSYGHEDDVTRALSAQVDLRVLWGGDATVKTLRAMALPAHAVELTFPDRWSFAVIGSDAYAALDDGGRRDLAERFFNDAYWFDQLGCSSPRLVAWLGPVQPGFFTVLAAVARERGWVAETGTALDKLHFAYRAVIDGPVESLSTPDNAVTVLQLSTLEGFDRDHPGGGLFYSVSVDSLGALESIIERRDQTLAHFGVPADDLRAMALRLNGKGVDRFVPVGQALAFHRYWDGFDLLQSFTRRITLEVSR